MKNLILILTSTVVLSSARAQNGKGVDGGEILKSTEAEVIEALINPSTGSFKQFDIVTSILRTRLLGLSFYKFHDRRINGMLQAMDNAHLLADIDGATGQYNFVAFIRPIILKPDQKLSVQEESHPVVIQLQRNPCDNDEAKDASIRIRQIEYRGQKINQGQICLNITALQKLKGGELEKQAVLLIIHEYAHLVGFGEDDAQYLQQFLSNHLYKNCWIGIRDQSTVLSIEIGPRFNEGRFMESSERLNIETEETKESRKPNGPLLISKRQTRFDGYWGRELRSNFNINWNRDDGPGEILFQALDEQGELKDHLIQWKALRRHGDAFFSLNSGQADFTYDGQPLKAHLGIFGGCAH